MGTSATKQKLISCFRVHRCNVSSTCLASKEANLWMTSLLWCGVFGYFVTQSIEKQFFFLSLSLFVFVDVILHRLTWLQRKPPFFYSSEHLRKTSLLLMFILWVVCYPILKKNFSFIL